MDAAVHETLTILRYPTCMHRRINLALAATALGLAGVVTWDVLRADEPAPPLPVMAARTPHAAAPRPSAAALAALALARPLFTPGRRPASPELASRPEAPSLPRLVGVTTGFGAATAFLAQPAGGTVALELGGRIDELMVREINADSVILQGSQGVRVLHLAFTSSAAPDAALPGPALPGDVQGAGQPLAGLSVSEVRAVLASAEAMDLAGSEPQGCCASGLGWWRLKPAASHGG